MWRYPGWLAFVAALLLSAAPAKVDAVQTDVRGNWQINLNCDLNATASLFWLLDEDIESGTITADDTGLGVRIGGTWENGPVTFYDPMGAICWSMTNPPSCSFDMRRNDLAVGDNVSVSPREKTTVTFEHVISPGTVEVEPLTEATGTVPENFEVLGSGGVSIFYDVRTTATFAGTITSCFPYPDANGDGIVDGSNPPLDETELRVLHEENGVFVDRTVSLDTTAKIICGQTTSLSQLTIAHLPAPPSHDHALGAHLVIARRPSGSVIERDRRQL